MSPIPSRPLLSIEAMECVVLSSLPPGLTSYLLWSSVLALVLLLGAGVIYWYKKRQETDELPPSDEEMLAEFQRAYDRGEMDEAEFRRVRDLLIGRIVPRPDEGPATAQDGTPSPEPESPPPTLPPAAEPPSEEPR